MVEQPPQEAFYHELMTSRKFPLVWFLSAFSPVMIFTFRLVLIVTVQFSFKPRQLGAHVSMTSGV